MRQRQLQSLDKLYDRKQKKGSPSQTSKRRSDIVVDVCVSLVYNALSIEACIFSIERLSVAEAYWFYVCSLLPIVDVASVKRKTYQRKQS